MDFNKKVSFIIVNYNGKSHLENCFVALKDLNYPKDKLEFVVVDNGSNDGSVEFLEKYYPNAKIIKNKTNEGFAKPNNDASKIATGEYLALINNDMKLDPNWLNDMFETLDKCNDESYVCAGSKILNWDGSRLDFIGGNLNIYGHGYQIDHGKDIEEFSEEISDKDILFACGGAMLIRRDIFTYVGGFDDDYFAYYEDCDLGWRLWILGYKIRFCSSAICYHKHNSTSKNMNRNFILNLFATNSLFTIYKNYEKQYSENMVLTSIMVRNYLNSSGPSMYPNEVLLQSTGDFLNNVYKMIPKRDFIQKNRKQSDEFIFKKFIDDPMKNLLLTENSLGHYNSLKKAIKAFNFNESFLTSKIKILLVISDPVGNKMAGPGIRYLEFARELSKEFDVTLAALGKSDLDMAKENFKIVNFTHKDPKDLLEAFGNCEVLIFQGFILEFFPPIKNAAKGKFIVVDLYDPFTIEVLEVRKHIPINTDMEMFNDVLNILLEQIRLGDFFICASETQKQFWLGMLKAYGKLDNSDDINNVIDIVPFGITNREPVLSKKLLSTKIKNLKENDKVIIWGGGVWNWFDPITVIKAVYELSKTRDDVKLFFLGVKHPNPDIQEMEILNKSVELAEELGIRDSHVFFNMDWVEYDDRENYFLESFIGISCHYDHLETRFSFRTRVLDYLWCNLPIISTKGDFFADEIENHKLGITIENQDVEGCKNAIIKLIEDEEFYNTCKDNILWYKNTLRWNKVIKPLEEKFSKDVITKLNVPEKVVPVSQDESIWTHRHYFKSRILVNLSFTGFPSIKQYIKNNLKIILFFLFYFVIFKEILKVNQENYVFFLVSGLIPYFFLDRTIRGYFSYSVLNLTSSSIVVCFCDAAAMIIVYTAFYLPIYLIFNVIAFIYHNISLLNIFWCILSYVNITAVILLLLMITMIMAKKKPMRLNRIWIGILPFLVFVLPILFNMSFLNINWIYILFNYNPLALTFTLYRDVVLNFNSLNVVMFLMWIAITSLAAFIVCKIPFIKKPKKVGN